MRSDDNGTIPDHLGADITYRVVPICRHNLGAHTNELTTTDHTAAMAHAVEHATPYTDLVSITAWPTPTPGKGAFAMRHVTYQHADAVAVTDTWRVFPAIDSAHPRSTRTNAFAVAPPTGD